MRVCPCCGYVDSPYWLHARFSYYIDTCTFQNFQIEKPDLAAHLKKPGDHTEDKDYVYYLTKSGHAVMRKAKIDIGITSVLGDGCESGKQKWKPGRSKLPVNTSIKDFGKHWLKHHPNQLKLVKQEVSKYDKI